MGKHERRDKQGEVPSLTVSDDVRWQAVCRQTGDKVDVAAASCFEGERLGGLAPAGGTRVCRMSRRGSRSEPVNRRWPCLHKRVEQAGALYTGDEKSECCCPLGTCPSVLSLTARSRPPAHSTAR